MIIGISGKIGHGKDEAAKIIKEILAEQGIVIEKKQFAGKLKQFVASLIGCSIEQLDDQDFKKSTLPPEWNRMLKAIIGYEYAFPVREFVDTPMTVREMLISIGHGLRVNTHADIWINGLMSDYKGEPNGGYPEYGIGPNGERIAVGYNTFLKYPNWIIPDLRYVNEAERIIATGGVVLRIERPGIPVINHESETLLDDYGNFKNKIVNDGTLDDLRSSLKNALKDAYLLF
jgi:hypothetical protein